MRYIQKFFEKVDIEYLKNKYPLTNKIWNYIKTKPAKYQSFLAKYFNMRFEKIKERDISNDLIEDRVLNLIENGSVDNILKVLQIDNKPITILNKLTLVEIETLYQNYRYIMDWQNNPDVRTINLKKYTWEEAVQMSKEWHDMIALKAEGDKTIENETGNIIKKYDNGYYWIDLETDCDEEEGRIMSHCGTSDGNNLYSLRKNQQPFVTISVKNHNSKLYVVQCKGKGNKKPIDKYYTYVLDFYKVMKIDYFESEYKEDEDFSISDFKMVDLFDLVNNYNLKIDVNEHDHILTDLLDYIEENNLFDILSSDDLKHELTIQNRHIYDMKYSDDVFFKDGKLYTCIGVGEFHKFLIGLPKLDFETFIPITYDISKCIIKYLFDNEFIIHDIKIDYSTNRSTDEMTDFGKTNINIFNLYYENHITDIFTKKNKECQNILDTKFMEKACELNSFENINSFYEPFGFFISKKTRNTFNISIDYKKMYETLLKHNIKMKYEIARNGSGLTKMVWRYKEAIGTETYNRKKNFITTKINALSFFKKYMKITK